MLPLIVWIIIFVVSIFVLIKSADFFTDSAEKIGIHFGIPAFIVGVTIVSIGTSLPELITSIISIFRGASEIVIGTIVGSNIANIFLVLGVAAIVGQRLRITYEIIKIDIPILVASAFLLAVCIWDGAFTFIEALLCIIGFVAYILYTINIEKRHKDKEIKKEMKKALKKKKLSIETWIILVLSAVFIYFGSRFTVESAINIAKLFNIGAEIIAVSAVALGTSLPELVVSITAALKGKPEMAIGNILGSNIFNALAVLGIAGLFGSLIIPAGIITFALPMMLIATLLFVFMTLGKEVSKWEGLFLIIFYIFFIGKLFGLF